MRSTVLEGNNVSKQEYVEKYIKDNNIASYNILRFQEPLKIADARRIKELLGRKLDKNNRLVVIESVPTPEAQNALLKTLEELPDETTVLFFSDKGLLPTVLSRCFVVRTGGMDGIEELGSNFIESWLSSEGSVSDKLLAVDELFSNKNGNIFFGLILELRSALISAVKSGDVIKAKKIYEVFESLSNYSSLIEINNLNARLVVEKTLLISSK